MQGLERSERFFREAGLPLLERDFPELLPRLAAGMAGRGSECFGYDDEISRDHDYTTGFTLYLSKEDEARYGFKLQRAYLKLVKELGEVPEKESKLGPVEYGVVTIEDFYRRHIGLPGAPVTWQQWLYTPEYAFAECTNGKVFMDNSGIFSKIRSDILYGLPEDVRLKKIAARLAAMAQSGQYNFERCLKHNEPAAAALALAEFVKNTVPLVFLLNFRFAPYYKWQFRAMKELPCLSELVSPLTDLLTGPFSLAEKASLIETVCGTILRFLQENGMTQRTDSYLEPHAFEIMKQIRSSVLRELHLMEG